MTFQLGVDYASVDGNGPPNFARMKGAGTTFVILRKSYILTDVRHGQIHLASDPTYARDAAHARAVGLTVGAYGFFSFAKGAPSAVDQIASLLGSPGDVVPGKDLPYCIDVEFPGRGIQDTGRTQAEVFATVLDLVREVRRQTGILPLLYTSHVEWHDDNGLGGPDSPELDGVLLWLKTPYRQKAGQPLDTQPPRAPHVGPAVDDPHDYWRVPLPWQRQGYWLQQYQGDAVQFPGVSATLDVSRFGTLDRHSPDTHRVVWLQRRLSEAGHTVSVDGLFGDETLHAVRAFQAHHGLPATGSVDVATFASLAW